jgi:hypothetical protein
MPHSTTTPASAEAHHCSVVWPSGSSNKARQSGTGLQIYISLLETEIVVRPSILPFGFATGPLSFGGFWAEGADVSGTTAIPEFLVYLAFSGKAGISRISRTSRTLVFV